MDLSLWEELRGKLNLGAVPKPVIAGLGAVLVVVAVLAGRMFLGGAGADGLGVEVPAAEAQETQEPAPPQTVFVHVSGAVAQPGLVEVPAGARVADAIQAAGGLGEGADSASVNLARVVADGEQVLVGTLVPSAAEGDGAAQAASASGAAAAGGKVNINTATAEQLTALPGVGQATAEKIVADRKANGPFSSASDLTRVSGIGQKKLEAMIDLIAL